MLPYNSQYQHLIHIVLLSWLMKFHTPKLCCMLFCMFQIRPFCSDKWTTMLKRHCKFVLLVAVFIVLIVQFKGNHLNVIVVVFIINWKVCLAYLCDDPLSRIYWRGSWSESKSLPLGHWSISFKLQTKEHHNNKINKSTRDQHCMYIILVHRDKQLLLLTLTAVGRFILS